jgi:competence protein ComEA
MDYKEKRVILIFHVIVCIFLCAVVFFRKDIVVQNMNKIETKEFFNQYLININKADIDELLCLQRVGYSIAERILDYRFENEKFLCIEDLMNVKGIGPSLYNKNKDKIKI